MVCNKKYFKDMQDPKIKSVTCGGGEEHKVIGSGIVTLQGTQGPVHLTEVLYVPTQATNVLSGLTALQEGFTWLDRRQHDTALEEQNSTADSQT